MVICHFTLIQNFYQYCNQGNDLFWTPPPATQLSQCRLRPAAGAVETPIASSIAARKAGCFMFGPRWIPIEIDPERSRSSSLSSRQRPSPAESRGGYATSGGGAARGTATGRAQSARPVGLRRHDRDHRQEVRRPAPHARVRERGVAAGTHLAGA